MKMKQMLTLLVLMAVVLFGCGSEVVRGADDEGVKGMDRRWADDPIWFDGKAEWAVYDAVRPIYGTVRRYEARIITNKEHFSTKTFTKSARGEAGGGLPVFKHHIREDIPVANYVYHYGMMSYVGVDDFKSWKLDHGSIEDCGTTYKRFVNWDGEVKWEQDSYFPNEGSRDGEFDVPRGKDAGYGFLDAMTLVLRGYPYDVVKEGEGIDLKLLPDQTTTKWSPVRTEDWRAVNMGKEKLNLPIGKLEAYHVQLRYVGPTRERREPVDFWFDASDDRQRLLVKYAGPHGVKYELKSVKRFAYWAEN
ncbi:hypothetical protein KS4_25910 [Poriferisphaera corsica]|uniref:DUF3108 domain-containing protein n=1 Tax=Poriferisphaera corsica TaxID=2528020 RepID=A0A517YWB0_9BACT|nr:DUF3108 domain-containing protein [Poriferisphaera corsica]QDU34521.1 hypothetical protein KS4_25910 [Poriferisphaera corsica]